MRRLLRATLWFLAFLVILPVLAGSVWSYSQGWPAGWNSADWSATNMLAPARMDQEASVRIFAARSGRWKGIFAVHQWILIKPRGAPRYTRYEVVGWGSPIRRNAWPPDGRWYSNPPEMIYEMRGDAAAAVIPQIEAAVASYPWHERGSYQVWPGPNSNSFMAHIARKVPALAAELEPTAVGKDYLGPGFQVAPMPSGTGWQISYSGLIGAGAAWKEGLELHLLGSTVGFDFDDLRLKLPAVGGISFEEIRRAFVVSARRLAVLLGQIG